jgi:hypothetical protein
MKYFVEFFKLIILLNFVKNLNFIEMDYIITKLNLITKVSFI